MRDLSKYFADFDPSSSGTSNPNQQFDQFDATTLFCSHCNQAVPVRKKLLLVLADGDKYDYICPYCGNSVGKKVEKKETSDQLIVG